MGAQNGNSGDGQVKRSTRPFPRDGAWYCQDSEGKWYYWKIDQKSVPQWEKLTVDYLPPPGSTLLARLGSASGPFLIYITGLSAILAVMFVTIFFVSKDPKTISAVLASVTGVIGAFTGHAAGHAAAKDH
jgi:hypothetical protein